MNIEDRLKDLILEKHVSVRAFGQSIGIPNSTLDSILTRGVTNSSAANVYKICNALGINMTALLQGEIIRRGETRQETNNLDEIVGGVKHQLATKSIILDGAALSPVEIKRFNDMLDAGLILIRTTRQQG